MPISLSAMGYLVALTRGGSPSVDLMVATPNGKKTVTIQVKTGDSGIFRSKETRTSGWNWRVSSKAKELCGESVFYAFVDLKGGAGEPSGEMEMPDVFIVPADFVKDNLNLYPKAAEEPTDFWFDIFEKERTNGTRLGISLQSVSAMVTVRLSSRSSRPMATCRWSHHRMPRSHHRADLQPAIEEHKLSPPPNPTGAILIGFEQSPCRPQ